MIYWKLFTISYTFILSYVNISMRLGTRYPNLNEKIEEQGNFVKTMEAEKEPYRVLLSDGEGEIVEKKSRFIATVRRVRTEAEATAFIDEMKKKYWNATHNCSAFVVGEKAELTRCSDDGEPSGTAGRPMLEVLLAEGIRNVAVVVTRYFGGILLGTGGLVRAYTQAVKAGLNNCKKGIMCFGTRLSIKAGYTEIGKIQYILGQENIPIEKSEYALDVEFTILFQENKEKELMKKLTEATNGRAKISVVERLYFVDKDESD